MMRRSSSRASRRGAALLEAIIALAVLSISAIAVVRIASESYHALELSIELETRMERAHALLDAATLWSRSEIDQRLGDRLQGEMRMSIQRVAPALYHVTLVSAVDGTPLLETTFFRPELVDAKR
jgi:Tfp pilus assembly protein PilV